MPNEAESPTAPPSSEPSSHASARQAGLLVKIETDRRLGHEWDEWDGEALPNEGDFRTTTGKYFLFTAVGIAGIVIAGAAAIYLLSPRLAQLAWWLPRVLYLGDAILAGAGALWLGLIGLSYATDRALLPSRFAERGLLLKTLRLSSRVGEVFGVQRDWTDNAAVAVYNRLAWAREWRVRANEMLILIPRCLSRAALDGVMDIAKRYDVATFVATRGAYARQAIRERRPKAVVAVACERDMISGLRDVAGRLPVLGLTMQLPNGPCKDASLDLVKMEQFVRKYLR
ncbi:MAG TPA: DUF116 domain-containing protein [Gemmatimonadaceae bacterium]|nr:DUF116 domain-containing protein [Gemmatimonadaceae bacterium]